MAPSDLTVCLMTCGEETEGECLLAISGGRDDGSFVYQEVRDITPASRALNAMFTQCTTPFLIPLDADIVLFPGYLTRVAAALDEALAGPGWHSILFPLWDTLTAEKIFALKVFHMAAMRDIPYKDDPCPDILHYHDMEAAGLRSISRFGEDPIGRHVVRGPFFCYAKYRDLYMVHRTHPQSALTEHFKGGANLKERAWRHAQFFLRKWEQGDVDYGYCLAGMVEGLTAPLRYASKNLGNREMKIPIAEGKTRFDDWYAHNKSDRIFL